MADIWTLIDSSIMNSFVAADTVNSIMEQSVASAVYPWDKPLASGITGVSACSSFDHRCWIDAVSIGDCNRRRGCRLRLSSTRERTASSFQQLANIRSVCPLSHSINASLPTFAPTFDHRVRFNSLIRLPDIPELPCVLSYNYPIDSWDQLSMATYDAWTPANMEYSDI